MCQVFGIRSEAAIREVLKETGVWAAIVDGLGDMSYPVDETQIDVRFFVVREIGRGRRRPHDANRLHVWLHLDEAVEKATHAESKEVLRGASLMAARTKGEDPS